MPRLSIKGLADYMTSSARRQRSILRSHKYPDEDESRARILYYREARDRVAVYHQSGEDPDWLIDQADQLALLAASFNTRSRRRMRLLHNARALRAYAESFAGRVFEVLPDLRLALEFNDVVVTVAPDLHITERGREKIIKLEFATDEPADHLIRIICQAMFEAASVAELALSSSQILLLDVPRAVEHRGARMRSRMAAEIEAACENISAIWDRL